MFKVDRGESSPYHWFDNKKIRPYVFVREDMRVEAPGSLFDFSLFPKDPIWFNPLHMDQVDYADQILNLETRAFAHSGMAMPRWVFYDCAIMPGFVAGFAQKTSTLPRSFQQALDGKSTRDWTPISLFIIIPTMNEGEWFAHNLCTINSLVNKEERLYGLGFLTKAFGLWYANIETCCGATQWGSPALKLHTQYGAFELLTVYTPAHDYATTITYRLKVDTKYWEGFFTKKAYEGFKRNYQATGFKVNPKNEEDMIRLQRRIENHEGPFYLNPEEIRRKDLSEDLHIYSCK